MTDCMLWLLLAVPRASLALAISAPAVWTLLRVLKCRSATVHQIAWGVVLVQGWLLVGWPVQILWPSERPRELPTWISSSPYDPLPISERNEATTGPAAASLEAWLPKDWRLWFVATEAPVHTDSFKGRKVRTFGDTMEEFVRAAEGEAVPLSGSEQFDAYQQGAVDFGMTGVTSVKSRRLYEVMGHLVKTNHTAAEFVVVINETLWSGLSEAEQAIITEAAIEVERDLRRSYGEIHRQTLDWIAGNTTMKVSDLDAAQLAAWRKVAKPVHDAYLQRAGETGRALLAAARKLQ